MRRASAVAVVIAVCLLAAAGCGRMSVTFSIGPSDGELHETTVLTDAGSADAAKVAMIDIRGLIVDGPTPGLIQGGPNPVDEIVSRLQKAEQDPQGKAVVLRVNSPGGSVSASDTIYKELRRFRETTRQAILASFASTSCDRRIYHGTSRDHDVAATTHSH